MINDTSTTSLLVVAHGSRRQASNDEIRCLARRMGASDGQRYREVRCAFLELAEPSIPDGIQECIDAGAQRVVVMPYFLSAGRHVAEDIPNEVAVKRSEHPELDIVIAPYLGEAESMVALMLDQASRGIDAEALRDSPVAAEAGGGR